MVLVWGSYGTVPALVPSMPTQRPSASETSSLTTFESMIRSQGEERARLSNIAVLLDLAPLPFISEAVMSERAATACYIAGE